jgi:hypothetical protein
VDVGRVDGMTPTHILSLMDQIDTTEDEVQIERWGKQSPLLHRYARDRRIAIFCRRTGNIEKALKHEALNDHRYLVVSATALRHER